MIIPKLCGRLGNQAFQISAAIAHARKMETNWAIPRMTADARYWPNYFLNEVPLKNRNMFFTKDIYIEPRHCFDELPQTKDLTLNGYFQSEKYWPTNEEKEEIGNALGFHCNKQDYVAIHVRRGDYVSQFPDKHPPLPMDYYRMAMETFGGLYDKSKFKVYTDDIAWCKENFTGPKIGINYMVFDDPYNIKYCEIKDPLAAMRDMYNASGFIIANSTFSLFPALLRLDQPPTIAPAEGRWFGPGNAHLETCDLMPERFIKL